ncbi:amino acid ABC transporter permease [Caproiciproducens galactitolivorans]|uniref:Arginine transport system permease protein ArtQ n=1 Tax=Caproiciproducens galactitolivorans TaxID=642589 RepID=A0A4Z0XX96_9FIRM|nr:amino acid ABC transporter permease [Caproiciproducens galactitolivorans]QEY33971.1 amino acid ABC transporter permease [Caproiciproducens galactitolivorans]TGJ76064.1 arginine transport system permease protein ArtQ [Caproiciproducens galactitolivorans]
MNSLLAAIPLSYFSEFPQKFYDAFIEKNRYQYIVDGLGNTLKITFFAIIIGIVLGTIVALIKTAHTDNPKKLRISNAICTFYLTVIRGTPIIVQLMIMWYIVFQWSTNRIAAAILAFGINSGAYVAEIIRGGIQSVDKGQVEAGRSLGLNQRDTMVKIVFPQALKNVLPAIGNEFIALVKETSVAGYIAIQDLTKGGDTIRSITYDAFTPLLAVAAIYLLIVVGLTTLLGKLERRLHRSDYR